MSLSHPFTITPTHTALTANGQQVLIGFDNDGYLAVVESASAYETLDVKTITAVLENIYVAPGCHMARTSASRFQAVRS